MHFRTIYAFAAVLFLTLYASATAPKIALSGTVKSGTTPVEKAVVTLVKNPQYADTTDANGAFSVSNITGILHHAAALHSGTTGTASLRGSRLHFFTPDDAKTGSFMLHTIEGKCIRREVLKTISAGQCVVELLKIPAGVYVVSYSAGSSSIVQKLMVTGKSMWFSGNSAEALSFTLSSLSGSTAPALDQLKISKDGFTTALVDLSSYVNEGMAVTLMPKGPSETSLYKKYKDYFVVGAAVDGNSYTDSHAAIWKEHFNGMVCENEMKWSTVQPSEGNFQFGVANAMVNAARSNGMMVRGHAPVWFDQTPDWVFTGATKEKLLQRIRTHVTKVMQEFKGRVYAWDVVNEAVVGYDAHDNDVGEDMGSLVRWGYRNSKWYQIAGEDHIFEAFKAARAADPDAKLFYNDYWNYLDGKREFILTFVKKLKEQNLIDGIGLQCHLNIGPAQVKLTNQSAFQTVENLEKEILAYAALGLDVHITELDISIYTRDYTSDDKSRWYTAADLNEEYQTRLAARYKEVFDMLRKHADKISNVTFWGISDDNTWLSEFPSGRPDHPLLFDKHLKPKKAFDAIMDF